MRPRHLVPLLVLLAGCKAPAAAAPPSAFPVQRLGDRGFVLLPDRVVLPEGLRWTRLQELDLFFNGTATTLEIAPAPAPARAQTFSLPGVHDERSFVTDQAVFLRVRREAWNLEVAAHPSIGVERVVLALEIDLTAVAPRGAPFVFAGPPSGRRRIEREPQPFDRSTAAALDGWLAAAGYPRAGEAVSHDRFTGTDIEELHTAVDDDRLLVWRRGGAKLGALRMPMNESAWAHLIATDGEPLLVIEHGVASVSGSGLERRMTLQRLPAP